MEVLPKTVLIADDETVIRTNLSALFRQKGWDTVESRDGSEALALAVTRQPDLVVLDIMMPGVDGFEAFQGLRNDHRTGHIPVVMLTSVNDYQLGTRHDGDSVASDLGVTPPEGFVEKPMDASGFFRVVQQAVQN